MDVKSNHIGNEEFHYDIGQTIKHEVKEVYIYIYFYLYFFEIMNIYIF